MDDNFCREISVESGEPIAGSAVAEVDRWILLQYQGAWAPKAYPGAELPASTRSHLDNALASSPTARLQLIRQPGHQPTAGLALYLVTASPGSSVTGDPPQREILAYRLSSYEALLGIDLIAWSTGELPDPKPVRTTPLVLVCTHGQRDRCCAKWGTKVYDALCQELGPKVVWQCDHLGGHRFASTAVRLPDGISYGRLSSDDVPDLLGAWNRGQLPPLSRVRGRCAFPEAVQHAEWTLWNELGMTDPDGLRLAEVTPTDDGLTVVFEDPASGEKHGVELVERPLAEPFAKSCGADPVTVSRWVSKNG